MNRTLNDLAIDQSAVVDGLSARGGMRGRMLDIGLTQGASVRCLYAAPSGEPRAYLIRGAVIALRAEDAASVRLQTGEEAQAWD